MCFRGINTHTQTSMGVHFYSVETQTTARNNDWVTSLFKREKKNKNEKNEFWRETDYSDANVDKTQDRGVYTIVH